MVFLVFLVKPFLVWAKSLLLGAAHALAAATVVSLVAVADVVAADVPPGIVAAACKDPRRAAEVAAGRP